jgi:purine nucleoside phosphorylase
VAEQSARVIVSAMRAAGVRRVIAISAAGVGDSAHLLPGLMQFLLRTSTVGTMYADLERMEGVYRDSGLDWLAVRPVTLVDAAPGRRAKVVPRFRMVSTVGRAAVAEWLVDAAEAQTLGHDRTPLIGWR